MTVTAEQRLKLIRAASLIGRREAALSPFEAELVGDLVERYRDRGDRVTLTANETRVLEEAVAAMEGAGR